MKKILFALIILITPANNVYAAVSLDCCDLRTSPPESNPLLKSMPELRVSLSFAPQSELLAVDISTSQSAIRATNAIDEVSSTQYAFIHQEIAFFQTIFKERFEEYLGRSSRYLPSIRKAMKASTLPEDIAYLPLIESGFNPMAVSRTQATGLWQFMKKTAKKYGLRVDQWIDERHDPVKSTKAAMQYLQDLYEIFGSWPLSMASYNAGEGRIGRTLATTGATDYWELKAMGRMPRETRDYVPKFIAATMIAKNPEVYGFSVSYQTPMLYDEVTISKKTSLMAISRITGVSLAELKAYNPELRKNTTPPNYPSYLLKLPIGRGQVFLKNRSELARLAEAEHVSLQPARTSTPKKDTLPLSRERHLKHWVKEGETIGLISKQYRITPSQLLQANRLKKGSVLRAGRFLLIPRG